MSMFSTCLDVKKFYQMRSTNMPCTHIVDLKHDNQDYIQQSCQILTKISNEQR